VVDHRLARASKRELWAVKLENRNVCFEGSRRKGACSARALNVSCTTHSPIE
jgi:hypothetical protein